MATTPEVGVIRQVFKPGPINMAAGIIIGLLLIGAGCFGLFAATKAVVDHGGVFPPQQGGWSWPAVGFACVLSLIAIPAGWFLIRYLRDLMSFRVEVGMRGMRVTEHKASRVILWDDIESVEEEHHFMKRKYGLPPEMSQKFIVNPAGGEPLVFEENSISGHIVLAGMIQREIKSRSVPWTVTEHRF